MVSWNRTFFSTSCSMCRLKSSRWKRNPCIISSSEAEEKQKKRKDKRKKKDKTHKQRLSCASVAHKYESCRAEDEVLISMRSQRSDPELSSPSITPWRVSTISWFLHTVINLHAYKQILKDKSKCMHVFLYECVRETNIFSAWSARQIVMVQ